jgi:serine/threonine-protein phosphatase CPPED1
MRTYYKIPQVKIIILLFFLLVTTRLVFSQSVGKNEQFFFVQLTDPQFGMFESNKDFKKETELMEKAVNEINRLKPDFVVFTGDYVNNLADPAQLIEFRRIEAQIDPKIPKWYIPGNHDLGQPPQQKDIDTYKSIFGYDRFSFIHKNWLFIGINGSIIKTNQADLEEKQFAWLKQELEKNKMKGHTIIFTHYPFFIKSPDESETYSNLSPTFRKKYFDLFKEYGVVSVFAGHLHNNGNAVLDNINMITTSSLGKSLANVQSGFRIIKVFSDHVKSDYYSLDEMPQTINMMEK